MSNVFANTKPVADDVDVDFSGGQYIFPTDLYTGVIKTAYIGMSSSSQARHVTLIIDINGKEYRPQIWVTNGQGEVTYEVKHNNRKTGEVKNLPGFNLINSLCLLVAGKELGSMEAEERQVKVWDYDAKRELAQAVSCFTELHGETVTIAIQERLENKQAKNDSTGKYENTAETRRTNQVVKFFSSDNVVTISEVTAFIAGLGGSLSQVIADGDLLKAISKMTPEMGAYADGWVKKNKGVAYDKTTKTSAGVGQSFGGNTPNAPKAATTSTSSLFDD